MPIIDDLKATIARPLAEQRRLALDTMSATQVKALFALLPDSAWLQIADHIVRQEPEALGEYLITAHKDYVALTASQDVNGLFTDDCISQTAVTALIGE